MAKKPEMEEPGGNGQSGAPSGTETIQRSPADPSLALLELPKGTLVDHKYEVVGEGPIGQGGMGVVYRAKDARSAEREPLALKILRPDRVSDETARKLFAREQDWGFRLATGGARQDHLVVVVGHGEWEFQVPEGEACRVPYIAMEYVEGPSLEQILKPSKEKGLDPDEAFRISVQMAEGLMEAHRVLVHRDLKPSNVLIRAADGCVKISDFGIGWGLLDTGKREQTVRQFFTMEYASPEQKRSEEQDARSDQYSFGLILSEMFSGFLYDPHNEHPVGGARHLPFALDALIRRACARNRADRYPDMAALLEDLRACHRTYLELKKQGIQDRPPLTNSPEVYKLKGRLEALLESGAKASTLLPQLEELQRMAPLDAEVKHLGEKVREKMRQECLARRAQLLGARDWRGLAAWRAEAEEVLEPEEALQLAVEAELAHGEELLGTGALDEAEALVATWLLEKGVDRERRQRLVATLKNIYEQRLQARLSEANARHKALEASWKKERTVLEKSLQEARGKNEALATQMEQSARRAEDLHLENDRLKAALSEKDKTWVGEKKALESDAQALRTANQNLEKEVKALKAEVSRRVAEAEALRKELAKFKPIEVEICSEPAAARLTVDGVGRGETPVTVALVPGTHELVLAKEGYRELKARRDVTPGSGRQPIRLTLEALPRSTPTGRKAGDTWVNPKDGLTYVWIPAGSFQMGAVPGDGDAYPDEKPRHPVKISKGFWLCRTEVTVGAYEKFCAATGRAMPEPPDFNPNWRYKDHPIVKVNWDDAVAYCQWAGGRLPTEAEWEYAARAGTETVYWWGNSYREEMANCNEKAGEVPGGGYLGKTTPVGHYPANAWGLYDMLGNVWEWCADWFNGSYYASSPATDPKGPANGTSRVRRGGSWYHIPEHLRVSYRAAESPSSRDDVTGFRCVRDE
jgi:sulfatase modifying factor 1